VLLAGVVLGLIAGLLAGGRLDHLAGVRLRWAGLLFGAVIVRFGTEVALDAGVPVAITLQLPLMAAAFGILALGLWANRRYPGLLIAFIGVALNGLVVVVNGGRMPIWETSLQAIGLTAADVTSPFHIVLSTELDAEFLAALGPLADVIPMPIIQNVASIGDVFLAVGLGFFLFASLVRGPGEPLEHEGPLAGLAAAARLPRGVASVMGRGRVRPETGLYPGLADAAALERPLILAGTAPGLAAPALAPLPLDPEAVRAGDAAVVRGVEAPGPVDRAMRHPYVSLALDGRFLSLWVGQVISLFGDRIHQVAMAFLVLEATGSAAAVGLVFVAATLPNLLFGPIAGTLVDRWDQRQVMVVSDLLRAAAVVIIPVAASINLVLVYPLVFVITTISIFFRPARTAIIPRIVRERDLVTANSATWLGETMADIIGYPLAGIFVAFLGASLPLAFWLDGITYVASAVLIASVSVPPVVRSAPVAAGIRGIASELVIGWRFLRQETVLLANTFQGVAGQFAAGVMIAITPIYAAQAIQGTLEPTAVYGLLETGFGIGNLVGGFVIGLIGARIAKGRLVIVGYTLAGLTTIGLALTGDLGVAIALLVGGGIANMAYIIPSQTLFQERTPPDMIGRVVGFRFALVYGALTMAMAIGGFAVEAVGLGNVLILGGLLTLGAGLAGLLVPAVRDVR
jgi:DHA3 family macrolide efflux protein-like MFS transporter